MAKSADAFRTISEVAEWLGIQAHVLRFWESKFTQVRPIKRAGGRRYYRPSDMLLLGGIKQLLHEDGLTIKGVQKILREEGMSHVSALSMPLDELTQSQMDDTPEAAFVDAPEEPDEEKGVVLNFEAVPAKEEPETAVEPEISAKQDVTPEPEPERPTPVPLTNESTDAPDTTAQSLAESDEVPEPVAPVAAKTAIEETTEPAAESGADAVEGPEVPPQEPQVAPESRSDTPLAATAEPADAETIQPTAPEGQAPDSNTADLPAFLRRPMADQPAPTDNAPPAPVAAEDMPAESAPSEPEHSPAPKPRVIDMPVLTPEHEIAASPSALTAVYRTRHLSTAQAKQVAPLLAKLTILRDSMAAPRKGATNTDPASGPNA